MAVREEGSRKRRKVERTIPAHSVSFTHSDQLRHLLQLSHSSPFEVKSAIDHFTDFLSTIPENQDSSNRARQLKILKDYCETQSSTSHDQVDFPDLLSIWASASQSNDEPILSAVTSALVQFFQTISSDVDFRDFGLSLCHSLLKRDQLRILDKGLSSPRSKEHITSLCLQLLTEITSFDGGALASNVFARRDHLYRRLDGILAQTASESADGPRFTPHRAALEFLSANLKYLDSTSKSELITHGKTLYSALRSLPNEKADIVIRFLSTLEKSVLEDNALSKQIKSRCFNSGILSALAKLYDYQAGSTQSDGIDRVTGVRNALHQLLLQVCTTTRGVLVPQSGWYPPGTSPESQRQDEDMIDLGLDSPYYFDHYSGKVPVKNGTLSTFIQTLRPESDIQQANLITSIFVAAPELVAEYFTKKQRFLVPPGDNPLWRGQFAFLFSVVQLPVPPNCGWHGKASTPPPLSIVIESIVPRPFDRSTITKCLRINEDIMTMSSTRLLTVAFEKLDSVVRTFERAFSQSPLWSQASRKLINLFVERIPVLQDVITTLQSLGNDKEQVRTTVLECIAAYHRILPSTTAGSKFDIGPTLSKALRTREPESLDTESRDILDEQVVHLLQIADISPATKWFHKSITDSFSLIVRLLQCCIPSLEGAVAKQSIPILRSMLTSKGILNSSTRSLEALIQSLISTKKWQPEPAAYEFLDNCITRTMQRPAKYLDQLEQMQQMVSDSKELSLVACCVAEQWFFVPQKEDEQGIKNIAEWIARFFSALDVAGENYRVMMEFRQEMVKGREGNEKAGAALEKAFEKQRKKSITLPDLGYASTLEEPESGNLGKNGLPAESALQQDLNDDDVTTTSFPPPPAIPTSLTGLERWNKPDFESEIQSGHLASLLRCLISPSQETRIQAFHTLQTVTHAVEQSAYDERIQLYLLLGEVSETIRAYTASRGDLPPPSIVAELAIHMLPVIADPSSPFYRKANRFLLRSPSWSIPHLLSDLLSTTFLTEPEADDTELSSGGSMNAQTLEIEHFLSLLTKSLRTETDMDLFRRAHVFSRLFAYYLTPICSATARREVLRLVHRATTVRGGSDTLITRAGVREWFAIAKGLRGHSGQGAMFGEIHGEMAKLLDVAEHEVRRTCDGEGIRRWEERKPVFKDVRGRGDVECEEDVAAKVDGANEDDEVQDDN
ncbi:uncharacterized protein Z518_02982 [Rhinocladiella mackenziei CBS 650.93]|uniref:Ribosome biogenesis protein Urb1 n=1 Tax=Rhinocladiella mackenziei CBS 650.93 TaxID=1442369 RepID=A0A0D2IY42_9EURO|nr:uncharacterized protein Z518_02982 [Rhinocladiella mackenziei CBS 650.93]KIX08326.1 hypothetical protein Z518_02982 [Rhinocladiella mackenziei CBS 650.93]